MKNYLVACLLCCGGAAVTSCTDYDDYNSVPTDALSAANNTLWENISSDQQLTKFAALAKKCNFSESLNSPRFYTVWAPIDGSISDAEYNRLLASDSATIVKQFMQHHVTEYNYPVTAAQDSATIITLNAKHHPFTQASFDGFPYNAINLPSSNGLMHKINGMSEFYYNLYENIDNLEGCDNLKSYIQKYDEYYLDVNASVIGPLVDGKQTYLDSVLKKRNNVIRSIMRADLEDEDSTFCMLVPNDKAWDDAYAKINPCYNYIPKMDYMDLEKKTTVASSIKATDSKADKAVEVDAAELQDSLTRRNIVRNLVFSKNDEHNLPLLGVGTLTPTDSVFSTSGSYLQNAQTVLEHTVAIDEMSNGMTRTIDSLTFRPWQTYNPTIIVKRPVKMVNGREVLTTLKVTKLTTHNVPFDSLAGRDSLFSKVPRMFRQWLFPSTSRFFSYVAVAVCQRHVSKREVEADAGLQRFFSLRTTLAVEVLYFHNHSYGCLFAVGIAASQCRARLRHVFNESCCSHRSIGQHKVVVLSDGKSGDGMSVITRLKLAHHHKRITLRNEFLDILPFVVHYA